ncbi:hypothetical protein EC991_000111 [Linnemannia zychae]|nr:hypothetical protein EC991_000111 [Linnemannia zychae]
MLTSDEDDDDDDDDEGGDDSSEDSESGDEGNAGRPVSFDSDDDSEVLSDSDYEASDDETPMMRLVSGFDTLHAWISSSAAALSALQDVVAVPTFLSGNSTVFAVRPIARIRRRQAAKECRRQLAEIRPWDGLPASLPLRTCGQWIQAINLQQEMPYQQRVMTQSFMQHPSPVRERLGAAAHSRAIQLLQQQQQQQQDGGGRYGILESVFRYFTGQQPQGILAGSIGASEPERLLSRRDFVNDWTVKTILDHCPGLCRLSLSECHGITDRSLEFIRDSACVAARTLVSLHIAGCTQITDRGLLGLLGHTAKKSTATTGVSTFSHRSSPLPSSCSSYTSITPFPASTSSLVRLESLDFAGCYHISDKGLIPLLKQCGSRLLQLRVSDCDNITAASVKALAMHCPNIQWLDLCRTGILTEECLILLAEQCTDLEWLNLARVSPQLEAEASSSSPLAGLDGAGDNGHDNDTNDNAGMEVDQDEDEVEQEEVKADDEKAFLTSTSVQLPIQSDDINTNTNDEGLSLKQDSITDRAIALLCESCPKLQLLDLSYIPTITNSAMESLSESAQSLVCLTIIGCPGITSQSLLYLARLRNSSGKLGCITMGDALGISERDIEAIMQGTLSGWQKSLVDETNLGEILGRSWDE